MELQVKIGYNDFNEVLQREKILYNVYSTDQY